jgi:thiol:disulfide interchange protein DsbD
MLLNVFSKKLVPGFILATMLTMGASTHPDSSPGKENTKPAIKKAMRNDEDKVKPVHSLFTYVKSLDELKAKLKAAKGQNKPVMIEFFASWCPACRAIDAQVLSQPSIQHLMRPFVNLRVDLTNKSADLMQIATYYQVYGTPSFIFFDKHGNEYKTERFRTIGEFKSVLVKLGK